jgi:hypothetical protein
MKKKTGKKLVLAKETLHSLSLLKALGGIASYDTPCGGSNQCESVWPNRCPREPAE